MNKEFIAFCLLVFGVLGGAIATTASFRARDLFFLAMICLAPLTENYDVNFVSRDWYRGTVRGFELSLVDILSLSLLAGLLLRPRPVAGEPEEARRWHWPASLGLMLVFLLYCGLNIAVADPKLWGLFELFKMLRVLIVFLVVALFLRSERELKLFLLGWALIICYQGLLAIEQRYRFGIHRVFGTLVEANSLSVFFCTTVPVLVAAFNSRLPSYLKALCAAGLALAAVGEVLTISRAGTVAFALVLGGVTLATMSYRINARKIAIALVVALGIGGVTAKSWHTLKARFAESTLEEEYEKKNNMGRGYYIRLATLIAREQLFGVGLNSWSYWVSNKYGPRLGYRFVPYKGTDIVPSEKVPPNSNVDMAQAAPAHNLGALTLGELGIPGFVLWLLLWIRWFQMGGVFLLKRTDDPMFRVGVGLLFGLSGMFLQSLTEWVFRQSPLHYTIHILLGALAALYFHRKRFNRGELTSETEEAEEDDPEFEDADRQPGGVDAGPAGDEPYDPRRPAALPVGGFLPGPACEPGSRSCSASGAA